MMLEQLSRHSELQFKIEKALKEFCESFAGKLSLSQKIESLSHAYNAIIIELIEEIEQ